jgi:polysaccharide deacetylase family protein (PEP-CTERM system associated)
MKHFVFSIDVEDWFQVENLKGIVLYDDWHGEELRISESTEIVLDILRRHSVRATFFILGWIAEKEPDLVKNIASQGHEIASHGYKHELLHTIDENSIESDIRRSLQILAPLSCNDIIGYRAPSFSITKAATNALKKMNFVYDASLNDFQFNRRYGKLVTLNRTSKSGGNVVEYSVLDNGLIEFPISVNTYFNIYWPLGGGYCRLSPMWFLRKQLHDILRRNDIASIYLHPWEFDSDQPRLRKLGMNYYFRHYYGLDKTAEKVERLIRFVKESPDVEIRTFGEIAKSLDHIR